MNLNQIEKDRLFIDDCINGLVNGRLIQEDNQHILAAISNRLLTERENAEIVYQYTTKAEEPWSSEDNYYPKEKGLITVYSDGSHDFIHSTTTKKGVWIPIGEAE